MPEGCPKDSADFFEGLSSLVISVNFSVRIIMREFVPETVSGFTYCGL